VDGSDVLKEPKGATDYAGKIDYDPMLRWKILGV
jgi:hypothetical protein